MRDCLRAGLTSGFPSAAPPPVLVPAILGTLAVWIPNPKKKERCGGLQTNLKKIKNGGFVFFPDIIGASGVAIIVSFFLSSFFIFEDPT